MVSLFRAWLQPSARQYILTGFPDLEREDIQQALEYAAWLRNRIVLTFDLDFGEIAAASKGARRR
jgi:hypothetical protein